jgi:hypothetical protein
MSTILPTTSAGLFAGISVFPSIGRCVIGTTAQAPARALLRRQHMQQPMREKVESDDGWWLDDSARAVYAELP